MLPFADVAARLAAATIAGSALGANRNLHGKAAGLRTHGLVALGSALVATAAADIDPAGATRVMQGVITGIGFIGAGVILHPSPPAVSVQTAAPDGAAELPARLSKASHKPPRHRPEVRGLTTAATVWVAAALGLASGLGAWSLVLLGTAFAFALLVGGRRVEDGVRRRLLARLRHRRAALHHHHGARHEVRVRERHVHSDDA